MSLISMFKNLIFTEPNQVKLTVTSDLSFLNDSDRSDIHAGYADEQYLIRLSSSFLNALFTQRKTTFLFSKRVFCELLRNDTRAGRKTINTKDFKAFKHFLLKNNLAVVHRDSSAFDSDVAVGSIFEVIEPSIVEKIEVLVGKEYLLQQKLATIQFYDSFSSSEVENKKSPAKSPQEKSHGSGIVPDLDHALGSGFVTAQKNSPNSLNEETLTPVATQQDGVEETSQGSTNQTEPGLKNDTKIVAAQFSSQELINKIEICIDNPRCMLDKKGDGVSSRISASLARLEAGLPLSSLDIAIINDRSARALKTLAAVKSEEQELTPEQFMIESASFIKNNKRKKFTATGDPRIKALFKNQKLVF